MGHCHLQCFVYYIQLLWCHYMIIVMLFGLQPLQSWIVWLRGFILSFLTSYHCLIVPKFLLLWLSVVDFIQLFKSLYQISPPYLHNIFQFSTDMTGHVSRNINHLFVPRVFTNFGKRSFFYRGTVLWNNLPLSVSKAATLSSFKNSYFNFSWFLFLYLFCCFVFILFCYIIFCYCICFLVVTVYFVYVYST